MHEMSIAQSVLNIVLEEARRHGAEQVTSVRLRVGRMTGVVPDSLSFCWGLLTEDTPAAGSVLNIEEVELRAACRDCGADFGVDGAVFKCPDCGSAQIEITQGRQMTLQSIEAV